jgi:subtilisin family serine protease
MNNLIIQTLLSSTFVVDAIDDTDEQFLEQQLEVSLTLVHPKTSDDALYYIDGEITAEQIASLGNHPLVEAIEPSLEYTGFDIPDDPMYSKQWNMECIGLNNAWTGAVGKNVLIAVIDTGLSPGKDLQGISLVSGVSFVTSEKSTVDLSGHGTHVAGTIAQATNNSYGVAGISPNAKILPLKVLDKNGVGRSEWIAAAIDEAVDQKVDIINLSLGGPPSKIIANAINNALLNDVLIVAASGNAGSQKVSSPANISGVIAVSAIGPDKSITPYSNTGKEISFSAPGGNTKVEDGGIVQETVRNGQHDFIALQGTSMAAPHVTGALAVLLSEGAGTTKNALQTLEESTEDLGDNGRDSVYGFGLIRVDKALEHIRYVEHGGRFAVASGIMVLLSIVGRLRFPLLLSLFSGYLAGGIFFQAPNHWIQLNLFRWLSFDGLMNFLWYSSLLSFVVVMITLPYNRIRSIGIVFATAMMVQFLFGLLDNQIPLPSFWLLSNCLITAMLAIFSVLVHRTMKENV